MSTTIRVTASVTKRCPFKDEVDNGVVHLTFAENAPELHNLAAVLAAYRNVLISHEDFNRALLLRGAVHVCSTWTTAGLDVVVTSEQEGQWL